MSVVTRAEVRELISGLDSDTYNDSIDTQIPLVEDFITEYCNNHFTRYEQGYRDDYTYFDATDLIFANSGSTITDNNDDLNFSTDKRLAVGDDIYLMGSRKNDGHYDIKTITDTVITVGDLYELVDESTTENYRVNIFLVFWPRSLKLTAAQMIEYNILYKYNSNKDVKSEKIGDYSVTFGGNDADTYTPYPKQIMDTLAQYKMVGSQ